MPARLKLGERIGDEVLWSEPEVLDDDPTTQAAHCVNPVIHREQYSVPNGYDSICLLGHKTVVGVSLGGQSLFFGSSQHFVCVCTSDTGILCIWIIAHPNKKSVRMSKALNAFWNYASGEWLWNVNHNEMFLMAKHQCLVAFQPFTVTWDYQQHAQSCWHIILMAST